MSELQVVKEGINQELRRRILELPGVTERQNHGIHEDAFFAGGAMFMHIHGAGHCDIRLPKDIQAQVLAAGEARPHTWAPGAGYVTFIVEDEQDIERAMDLIKMSYDAVLAGKRSRVAREDPTRQ